MIEVKGLKKDFGKGIVLQEIDLTIEKGERVMIVGGNGSGKTTLLRCIIGSYVYDGKVSVKNLHTRKNKAELARIIGYVPQIPPPILMTVEQLVGFVCKVDDNFEEKDIIYSVLDRLQFEKEGIKRHFKKLSGGMQKKVLMAIALGREPEVLILDEPLAYIDPNSREIISEVVNSMPDDLTLLYTSHREERGSIKASRVIEMDNGYIIKDEYIDK